uniref:AAA family ATPase n=1 Tax=Paractinoplanes polyasparticus TaxID=2856853 RepID=UPI001C8470DF|nr:ATP-binding protein [Actinoplanes polyasparticus]
MSDEPYATSAEHLADELRRVELLVRAQVERWRTALADLRPATGWGTGILDDEELVNYLAHSFTEPMDDDSPPEAHAHMLAGTAIAAQIMIRRPADGVELRVDHLHKAFDLNRTDLDVILICLLAELDARYRRVLAYLADEEWRKVPPVGVLAEILRPGAGGLAAFRARFAPGSPLIRHRLVALGEPAEGGLSTRAVLLDGRIAAYLGGQDHLDSRLAPLVTVVLPSPSTPPSTPASPTPPAPPFPQAGDDASGRVAMLVEVLGRHPVGATVALLGPPGSGRGFLARAVATELDVPLLRVDLRAQPPDRQLARDVYREARLRGAAVLWRGGEAVAGTSADDDRLWADLLARAATHTAPTFVDHAQPWDPPPRHEDAGPYLRMSCPAPDLTAREAHWAHHLDGLTSADPAQLAATYLLGPAQIAQAVRVARDQAAPADSTADDLREACRRLSSRRLMSIAKPSGAPTGMTLAEIVLPDDKKRELFALRDRIRNRPRVDRLLGPGAKGTRGLVAMFCGSSGTGKTLAAGLIARDLGRDLLRVDLSQMVSKWVGETEKNLDRVLAEAQDSPAILFFDEAEAVFGKRGTVSEARDRYAMQETSFLLQRIEEYEGVVILATNLRQNLDEAFSRRITTVIDFPSADEDCRRRLWGLALSRVPHDLTPAEIATAAESYRLSAAAICEVVVTASFVALARDPATTHLTTEDVDEAVRTELQRQGLPAAPGLRP